MIERFDECSQSDMNGTTWLCQLGELNDKCSCRDEDGVHCKGHTICCFCETEEKYEEEKPEITYVRKERWYEKYYRDRKREFYE